MSKESFSFLLSDELESPSCRGHFTALSSCYVRVCVCILLSYIAYGSSSRDIYFTFSVTVVENGKHNRTNHKLNTNFFLLN